MFLSWCVDRGAQGSHLLCVSCSCHFSAFLCFNGSNFLSTWVSVLRFCKPKYHSSQVDVWIELNWIPNPKKPNIQYIHWHSHQASRIATWVPTARTPTAPTSLGLMWTCSAKLRTWLAWSRTSTPQMRLFPLTNMSSSEWIPTGLLIQFDVEESRLKFVIVSWCLRLALNLYDGCFGSGVGVALFHTRMKVAV